MFQHLEGNLKFNIVHAMVLYSVELRELEAKLKAGYMNKERAAQLAEKEVIKKKEEVMKYCKL